MSRLPDSPACLSVEQRKLLSLLSRSESGRSPLVRSGQQEHVLSFAQQRIWFLEQLHPQNAAYNIHVALRIIGELNAEAFERACHEVVRRHETLRTRFEMKGEGPLQRVHSAACEVLVQEDLSRLDEVRRTEALQKRKEEEANTGFDLTKVPLLRARLLKVAKDEYVLLLTMHHIVSDGWSMGILIREMASLYECFSQGKPSLLPELEIQYGDYAVWQRGALHDEALAGGLAYWKKQLAGAPLLELPSDRTRPKVLSHRGAVAQVSLNATLTRRLRDLSRREGVTLFMTVLAALKVVLARWCGQQDIVVGTPIANRTRAEVKPLIGCFVNQLALRTDLSGNPSFRNLLQRVREVTSQAYAHQDVPFERVVDELKVPRDLSRNPIFQVVLSWGENRFPSFQLPGVRILGEPTFISTGKFDLTMLLHEVGDKIWGTLEYSTDLYDNPTVCRMFSQLQHVLKQVVEHPEKRIGELELLSEEEREQVVRGWNRTEVNYPEQRCIHELFEEQVERAPEALAVVHEGGQLSYGELNARANRVAQALRELGVGAEVRVGLYVERSVEMVVGILGILKAGGAYVPMDPEYPGERIAYMIEDAGLPVVLTQRRLRERLHKTEVCTVDLDGDWDNADAEAKNAGSGMTADNAAYVIYTSGSTGSSKGVLIPHRNVVRLFQATEFQFRFSETDVWTLFHSIAFDFSVWELWGALLHGGKLVIVPKWCARSPEMLLDLLQQHKVTVLNQTPSWFRQVAASALGRSPALSLRVLIFGGEALEPGILQGWRRQYPDVQLVNMYGITETTVHVTYALLTPKDIEESPERSIVGLRIADLQVYVLDKFLEPVPIGVVGELYIGGAGLARGYLNRAELTAERFIAHPYSERGGERLYRTGDLGKWRGDGNLEFVGRVDDQVKVRGYRIEPGEIAAVLEEHGNVQQAVVMVEEVGEQKQLVAYVVAAGAGGEAGEGAAGAGGGAKGRELRDYLRARLPEYMVPGRYVEVEKMPLTWNGKVDRKALVEMGREAEEARGEEGSYEGPRNATEELLARIWTEVLGRERVGIHDNFFELGGDSILAIQVVARARRAGSELLPRHLFEHQTIAKLADHGRLDQPAQNEQEIVVGEVPLTPVQLQFFAMGLAEPGHHNQAVMFEVEQKLEFRTLRSAFGQLLLHHDTLRSRFRQQDGVWREWISREEDSERVCVEQDLSGFGAQEREDRIQQEAGKWQRSLDLAEGPLLRAVLFRLGGEELNRLLIVIHHLVVDEISWRILAEDLERLCYSEGLDMQLSPKTTSYKQWAEKLHQQGEAMLSADRDAYWEEIGRKFYGIPVDARGENLSGSAQNWTIVLNQEETDALLNGASGSYHARTDDVLLTALVEAFCEWTGQRCLQLDVEGHGREDVFEGVNLSRTVGRFTAMYPVHLELPPAGDVAQHLVSIKEQLRKIPHGGLGFGLLKYLRARGDLPATREICFKYPSRPGQALSSSAGRFRMTESMGPPHGEGNRRSHLIDISARVIHKQMHLDWSFSRNLHHLETIQKVAGLFLISLRKILALCRNPETIPYSSSDYSEFRWSQQEFSKVTNAIERS